MIIEIWQFFDFLINGTFRLLFLFFFVHILFLVLVRRYSQKYRPFGHNPSTKDRKKHTVTVTIPTWKENPIWLKRAIESALKAGADEVIVSYCKGDEAAQEIVEKFGDRISVLTFERRVPKKVALYESFRRAKGDIICNLDSDTFLVKSSIIEICKAFDSDPKIGGVVPYNIIFNKKHFSGRLSSIVESSRNFINKAFSVFGNVHVLDSRFCAYRKEAIIPLLDQYLNNRFLGRDVVIGEDKMLTYLLQKSGWKCVMQASAVDYTAAPNNIIGFLKQQLRWARSGYMYFFRHRLCLKLHWLLTFHILLYFLSPIIFPAIVLYDVLISPPLLHMSLLLTVGVVTFGVSLITLFRAKLANLEIKLKDIPAIAFMGLFILLPLMLYALVTVWKQDSWVSK
jgi:cellulose synthase/poly-beta-1,6-N-acetylglucosamine synthase-like glycosyltransferase